MTVQPCASQPCPSCPWRTSNARRRSPIKVEGESYGWFSAKNRQRLWARLRRGDGMTCHPTDPRHPGVSTDAETKTCAGAVILQHRELVVIQELLNQEGSTDEAMRVYRRTRPSGLTLHAALELAWNATLGSSPVFGTRDDGRPDLNAAVHHPKLPWPPSCVEIAGASAPA